MSPFRSHSQQHQRTAQAPSASSAADRPILAQVSTLKDALPELDLGRPQSWLETALKLTEVGVSPNPQSFIPVEDQKSQIDSEEGADDTDFSPGRERKQSYPTPYLRASLSQASGESSLPASTYTPPATATRSLSKAASSSSLSSQYSVQTTQTGFARRPSAPAALTNASAPDLPSTAHTLVSTAKPPPPVPSQLNIHHYMPKPAGAPLTITTKSTAAAAAKAVASTTAPSLSLPTTTPTLPSIRTFRSRFSISGASNKSVGSIHSNHQPVPPVPVLQPKVVAPVPPAPANPTAAAMGRSSSTSSVFGTVASVMGRSNSSAGMGRTASATGIYSPSPIVHQHAAKRESVSGTSWASVLLNRPKTPKEEEKKPSFTMPWKHDALPAPYKVITVDMIQKVEEAKPNVMVLNQSKDVTPQPTNTNSIAIKPQSIADELGTSPISAAVPAPSRPVRSSLRQTPSSSSVPRPALSVQPQRPQAVQENPEEQQMMSRAAAAAAAKRSDSMSSERFDSGEDSSSLASRRSSPLFSGHQSSFSSSTSSHSRSSSDMHHSSADAKYLKEKFTLEKDVLLSALAVSRTRVAELESKLLEKDHQLEYERRLVLRLKEALKSRGVIAPSLNGSQPKASTTMTEAKMYSKIMRGEKELHDSMSFGSSEEALNAFITGGPMGKRMPSSSISQIRSNPATSHSNQNGRSSVASTTSTYRTSTSRFSATLDRDPNATPRTSDQQNYSTPRTPQGSRIPRLSNGPSSRPTTPHHDKGHPQMSTVRPKSGSTASFYSDRDSDDSITHTTMPDSPSAFNKQTKRFATVVEGGHNTKGLNFLQSEPVLRKKGSSRSFDGGAWSDADDALSYRDDEESDTEEAQWSLKLKPEDERHLRI